MVKLRWIDRDDQADLERVAEARLLAYGAASSERERFSQLIHDDKRPGEMLLAEEDGLPVGTVTCLSMEMWVRGGKVPCQGIAWVGTIRTHRRRSKPNEHGIATRLMGEAIRHARERRQVVSALMPFRASFYQHFGYGLVERRNEWTIPLSILPQGDFQGIRMMRPSDLPLIRACRQRSDEQGQCAIQRTEQSWMRHQLNWPSGFCVVDQPSRDGPIESWMFMVEAKNGESRRIDVVDATWDSPAALRRQLYFLGSLRDQFGSARLYLPIDLPLNRLLIEPQLEHRPVEHATADCTPHTRMQVRILDHVRFLQSLKLESDISGRATVSVRESEGAISTFEMELDDGHISAKPTSGQSDIECSDSVWASIACDDLCASTAAQWGIIHVTHPKALRILDVLARGPAPFCNEYF